MIIEIGNVLVSTDIITENFSCDLAACKGACCIEGDAGAPVKFDEIALLEEAAEKARDMLSAPAKAVIDKQGVVYNDAEGDLVTSIVGGRDCVFTCHKDIRLGQQEVNGCCLCALEACGKNTGAPFLKPISCALYPVREKLMANGYTALSYHRWDICRDARRKGADEDTPLYMFLREPLTRRFGKEWFKELSLVAKEMEAQGLL